MTPDQSFYDKDCKGYSQDIETAKKLAESSGLTGKTINYKFNSDRANMEAVATVVQQQLEKIGVKVNVQGADSTTFFKSFFYMWYGSGEKDTSWDLAFPTVGILKEEQILDSPFLISTVHLDTVTKLKHWHSRSMQQ